MAAVYVYVNKQWQLLICEKKICNDEEKKEKKEEEEEERTICL